MQVPLEASLNGLDFWIPILEGHNDQQHLFMAFAPQAHPWQD